VNGQTAIFPGAIDSIMVEIDPKTSTRDLMELAADHHKKLIELTEAERDLLISMLKERGRTELEHGEELEIDDVRLVHRVTGAVSIYFNS
jgi:hypothetical protein